MTIGERIKAKRKEKNISVEYVANSKIRNTRE